MWPPRQHQLLLPSQDDCTIQKEWVFVCHLYSSTMGGQKKWEKSFEPEYSQMISFSYLLNYLVNIRSSFQSCPLAVLAAVSGWAVLQITHTYSPIRYSASSICSDMIAHGLSTHPCLFSSTGRNHSKRDKQLLGLGWEGVVFNRSTSVCSH